MEQAAKPHASVDEVEVNSVGGTSVSDNHLPSRFTILKSKTPQGTVLNLAEDEHHPQQAVTLKARGLHRSITLHESSDPNSPAIAECFNPHNTGIDVDVTLAAIDGSPAKQVIMHSNWGLIHSTFDFKMPVREGEEPEKFVWRYSKGEEVKGLDRKRGFVLVRESRQDEVVAVWSTRYGAQRLSGEFAFVGEGANFGAQWSNMAVMTALCVGKMMKDIVLYSAVPVAPFVGL